MRSVLPAVAAALLLAGTACAAAGSGGTGAPKGAPANGTAAPSSMPAPTGGKPADPYDYGY
ncbi:MAG TPA: hypothetical protein VI056_03940 [Candidatus Limnocylindria bacterium]